MTNILTGAERFIAQWRQSSAEGNLYSPDDLTTYILGTGVVPGNGRQVSTLATYLLNNAVFNVKDYGAKGDGTTDDTATIQAAITAAPAGSQVVFPVGTYLVTTTLQVSKRNVSFLGHGLDDTTINFTGTGPCIQFGTDDANPWDSGEYNGLQGGGLQELALTYTGTTTPLANGYASYGAGSYGIRDWRGGGIRLHRVIFRHFENAFWGVQSDLNRWDNVYFSQNHVGAYFGARSDQLTASHIWTTQNDTVWIFEGASHPSIQHWTSDTDGSPTTNVFIARNSSPARNARYAQTRLANIMEVPMPWCEAFGSVAGTNAVEALFEFGVGDATSNGSVTIRSPYCPVQFYSTGTVNRYLYLVKADKIAAVRVEAPSGATTGSTNTAAGNLRAVFKIVNAGASTTVPICWFQDLEGASYRVVENFSATAVTLILEAPSTGTYLNNNVGGTGPVTVVQATPSSTPSYASVTADKTLTDGTTGIVRWTLTGVRRAQAALDDSGNIHFGIYGADGTTFISDAIVIRATDGMVTLNGGMTTGSGGSVFLKEVFYLASLTPSAVSATTSAEQTFTVTGLTTNDIITAVNPPASMPNGLGIVGMRASAADTLAIRFSNVTAGSLTPIAGTYTVIAKRR